MKQGGDSYYVLVNNKDDVYTVTDYITGYEETDIFNSWEKAEEKLQYLFDEDILDEKDGWHVERARW